MIKAITWIVLIVALLVVLCATCGVGLIEGIVGVFFLALFMCFRR